MKDLTKFLDACLDVPTVVVKQVDVDAALAQVESMGTVTYKGKEDVVRACKVVYVAGLRRGWRISTKLHKVLDETVAVTLTLNAKDKDKLKDRPKRKYVRKEK